MKLRWLLAILFMGFVMGAYALERFPPPDLGPDYVYPQSSQTPGRLGWLAWLDTAMLLIALSLASVFVYRLRSRRAMVWLSIASLAYFGFYRKGCVCPIGSIQNVTHALFDSGYIIPVTVLMFFALPLVFSLIFGRVFCGGVCPLGMLQDLVLIKALRVPRPLDRALGLLRYFYLGLAVLFAATGTAYIICLYDPFVGFFRMSARFHIWVWSVSLLSLSMFVGRPYCRFLCPYGALLGIFSRFSIRKVRITPDECIVCHLCRNSCPFLAIREGERKEEANT